MKKLILKLIRTYTSIVSVYRNMLPAHMYKGIYQIINEREAERSADMIEKHLDKAMLMRTNHRLWQKSLNESNSDGLFLELGVFQGRSIKFFAKYKPEITFYGFDSFQGLQEDWAGTEDMKGHFDVQGKLPKGVPSNCKFIKGWIKNTLPDFLNKKNIKVSFVHIDVDTYQSTFECLDALKGFLKVGTVIIFDEYHGFPGWRNGEFKAWKEFYEKEGISFEYLAFSRWTASLKIKEMKSSIS